MVKLRQSKIVLVVLAVLVGLGALTALLVVPDNLDKDRELSTGQTSVLTGAPPVLSGSASASDEARDVPSGPPAVASPDQLRTLRIAGRVLLEADGEPVPGIRVSVQAPAESPRFLSEASTDADGNFVCVLRISGSCRDVLAVGSGEQGGEPFMTYPSVEEVVPLQESVRTTLVLRRAALVRGQVESGEERILVSQLPSDNEDYYGWNLAGFRPLDSIVDAEDSHSFLCYVRPGPVVLRSLNRSQALGPPVSVNVKAGDVVDIGVLRGASETSKIAITVLDDAGSAIGGAWVQLSDRQLRLHAPSACAEIPHFLSDADGRVTLPPVSRDVFPLVIGVGAEDFSVREVTLLSPGNEDVLEVTLSRRRRISVQLVGLGTRILNEDILAELRVGLQELGSPALPVPGVPRPSVVLADFYQAMGFGIADASHHLLWFHRPRAGAYRVTISLGTSTIGSTDFVLRDDDEDVGLLKVSLAEGRAVRVRLALPADIPERVARRLLAIAAVVRRDPTVDPSPIGTDQLLARGGKSVLLWVPVPFDAIKVSSVDARLLPLHTLTHELGREADAILRLAPLLDSNSELLGIQISGADGSPVLGRWPVYLLPISGDGGAQIIALLTGEAGRLTLPVRVGRYEVRTDKSFHSPFSRVQIDVVADQPNRFELPIGP